jgi:DNA (cytosine-5)-methyltransferase 1
METSEIHKGMLSFLDGAYLEAENLVKEANLSKANIGVEIQACQELAATNHAFRGVAITLITYKLVCPEQDIRAHKAEHPNGFSARGFDTKIIVPFLMGKSLPHSVETHWLTQTISFAPALFPNVLLKTQPKRSGELLIKVVNFVEQGSKELWNNMLIALLAELIKIRNASKIVLTRPKNISIEKVKTLLDAHFTGRVYAKNAPRLPQIAIYAIYQAMMDKVERYSGQRLQHLARMKSADRKAGTVGDVVIFQGNLPWEAVEIKFKQAITFLHVSEAIEKVRAASVSRYYLLSTSGVNHADIQPIKDKQAEFLKHNGCEIIVNGVLESIGYYLRMLPNTTEFISNYASLVETDPDTDYEHRVFWNEVCDKYL